MKDWLHTFFYWLNVWGWGYWIIWLMTSRDVKGRKNIPPGGGLILASNHLNLTDPPILTAVMPRRVVWMAKQELFDIPVFGLLYHLTGCIPVRRFEADLRALRRAQQALRKGHVLGMFPEGTRGGGRGLRPGEPGTALLALRTGAPVLPVAIWGTERVKLPAYLFERTRVQVVFGEPFSVGRSQRPRREEIAQATDLIMKRIAALLPAECRGVYGEATTDVAAATKEGDS